MVCMGSPLDHTVSGQKRHTNIYGTTLLSDFYASFQNVLKIFFLNFPKLCRPYSKFIGHNYLLETFPLEIIQIYFSWWKFVQILTQSFLNSFFRISINFFDIS